MARTTAVRDLTLGDLNRIEAMKIQVERFTDNDLSTKIGEITLAEWLLGRMRDDFDGLNDNQLLGHVRSSLQSNEYYMVRTPGAVALAQAYRKPLSPYDYGRSIFIYAARGHSDEAYPLIAAMLGWARRQGIIAFEISSVRDIERKRLEGAFEGLRVDEQVYVRL